MTILTPEELKKRLPLKDMEKLMNKDPRNNEELYQHTGKYYKKMDLYLQEKIDVAKFLELEKGSHLRLLDIGAGIGLFPWLCGQMEHKCDSTYYDDFQFYKDCWALLEISEPQYLEVTPDEKWKIEAKCKYDVITAQRTVFDRFPEQWGSLDWLKFFARIHKYLTSNGYVFIKTNCRADLDDLDIHTRRMLEPWLVSGFNSRTIFISKDDIFKLLGNSR